MRKCRSQHPNLSQLEVSVEWKNANSQIWESFGSESVGAIVPLNRRSAFLGSVVSWLEPTVMYPLICNAPEFSKKLTKKVEKLKFGATSRLYPLSSTNGLEYLEIRKGEGKVLIGGVAGDEKGYFVRPTIFAYVKDDAKINKEETFGPVAILHRFSTEEAVLKRANDTEYGLAAYIFTKDISRAVKFARGLEAGQVGVNTGMADANLGFGRWKGSGIRRELGEHAIHAYTEVKSIFIR